MKIGIRERVLSFFVRIFVASRQSGLRTRTGSDFR